MELAGAANDEHTVVTAIDLAAAEADRNGPNRFDAIDALLSGIRRNQHSKDILGKDSMARLEQLATKCVSIAKDDNADVKTRVECIRILGRSPQHSADNIETLADFLSADHDSQLQLAAVDALAERSQPAVADHLLSAWRSLTPALRGRVLDVLLSRKQWVGPLLAAIEAHTVLTSEIDAAHQARLSEYPDPELRKKAQSSFAQSSSRADGRRHAAISRRSKTATPSAARRSSKRTARPATSSKASATRSARTSPPARTNQTKACSAKSSIPTAPSISTIAAYVAVTTDGVVKTGILFEETGNAITLLGQNGEKTVLLRSQLESLTTNGKSLMPEGLEKQITPARNGRPDQVPRHAVIAPICPLPLRGGARGGFAAPRESDSSIVAMSWTTSPNSTTH